jgi:hypothetical protein
MFLIQLKLYLYNTQAKHFIPISALYVIVNNNYIFMCLETKWTPFDLLES